MTFNPPPPRPQMKYCPTPVLHLPGLLRTFCRDCPQVVGRGEGGGSVLVSFNAPEYFSAPRMAVCFRLESAPSRVRKVLAVNSKGQRGLKSAADGEMKYL